MWQFNPSQPQHNRRMMPPPHMPPGHRQGPAPGPPMPVPFNPGGMGMQLPPLMQANDSALAEYIRRRGAMMPPGGMPNNRMIGPPPRMGPPEMIGNPGVAPPWNWPLEQPVMPRTMY